MCEDDQLQFFIGRVVDDTNECLCLMRLNHV